MTVPEGFDRTDLSAYARERRRAAEFSGDGPTLLAEAGVPGTTSDAAVVGCDPDDEPARFAGSATPVGDAARACVREAVTASLSARYGDKEGDGEGEPPTSVADAEHGTATARRATAFRIE